MKREEYSDRISILQRSLFELISSRAFTIQDILREKPPRFNVKGAYAISTPDDNGIVYVGKTLTKSVIGRVADHRNINTKSDLKGMLKFSPTYSQNIGDYLVRCIEIPDGRQRSLFEHFAISVLQPTFNR